MLEITALITAALGVYGGLFAYVLGRARKLRKMPPEVRKKLKTIQIFLYMYGIDTITGKMSKEELTARSEMAFSSLQVSWEQMQKVFEEFQNEYQ